MDRDFEKYLIATNTLDEYKISSEVEKHNFFEEYQYDFLNKDPKGFLIWMTSNPELAIDKFPDVYKKITDKSKKLTLPISIINDVIKFPNYFKDRLENVNNELLNSNKLKKINEYIILISQRIQLKHDDILYQNALDSISDQLNEELEYWRNQHKITLDTNSFKKSGDLNIKLSPVEIAIRHYILVKANIEKSLTPKELALKNPQKSFDNIRKALPIIEKKARNNESLGTTQQLKNVMNSLNAYPDQQAKIIEMINRFN